jgi:hypothetical protein
MRTLLKLAVACILVTGCKRHIEVTKTPYLTCFREDYLELARKVPEYQNKKLFRTSLTNVEGRRGVYYCMFNDKKKNV